MTQLTGAATRAARGILKWSVRDLAAAAGVSPTTVNLLEADRPCRDGTAARIVDAFRRHGVEITGGEGTGARLLFRYAYACDLNGFWRVFVKVEEGAPGLVFRADDALRMSDAAAEKGEEQMAAELLNAARQAAANQLEAAFKAMAVAGESREKRLNATWLALEGFAPMTLRSESRRTRAAAAMLELQAIYRAHGRSGNFENVSEAEFKHFHRDLSHAFAGVV